MRPVPDQGKRVPTEPLRVLAAVLFCLGLAACVPQVGNAPDGQDPFGAWRPFLECTIDHESRSAGTYSANTGNGYYGAFQFLHSTWAGAITRAGYPLLAGVPPVDPVIGPYYQDAGAVQLASERGAQPWGGRCAHLLP